jgi:hypothetical protein
VPVIGLADLQRNQLASGRTKDIDDLQQLPCSPAPPRHCEPLGSRTGLPRLKPRFPGYSATPRTPISQTGLPRLKPRFPGYSATPRTPISQTGLPRLKPRFPGYSATPRTPSSRTGLPRLKPRFAGYSVAARAPGLPDGLAPSETKVPRLLRDTTNPWAPGRACPV